MSTGLAVKKLLTAVAQHAGVLQWRLARRAAAGSFVILMYHRVLPADKAQGVEPGMFVTPETLKMHLGLLRDHFEVVSLRKVQALFARDQRPKSSKPFCVVTFDDGWVDTYSHAYPLLMEYEIPATLFLATAYIDSNKQFWTDRLARLANSVPLEVEGVIREDEGQRLLQMLRSSPGDLRPVIDGLKQMPVERIDRMLSQLEAHLLRRKEEERSFLSSGEIQEMAVTGLIDFGGHTHNHAILTVLAPKQVQHELTECREQLLQRGVVDGAWLPFCYPNGNHNEETVTMVRDAGYGVAVTTEKGWNQPPLHWQRLRRIGMHEDVSSTPGLFLGRLTGLV